MFLGYTKGCHTNLSISKHKYIRQANRESFFFANGEREGLDIETFEFRCSEVTQFLGFRSGPSDLVEKLSSTQKISHLLYGFYRA